MWLCEHMPAKVTFSFPLDGYADTTKPFGYPN
jgi:hypothetical protein